MKIISKNKEPAGRIILITTVLSVGYAILRYNIFGDVPWKDVPIFVLNKGISLASFILLVLSFSLGPMRNLGILISDKLLEARKSIGMVGLMYVVVHLVMSLCILNPRYYSNFFVEDTTLSLSGGLSLLAGVLGFALLGIHHVSFKENIKKVYRIIASINSKKIIIGTIFFIGIHVFFIGFTRWTAVNEWHGGLPPISLLSFTVFFLGFLINLLGRK